MNKRGILDKVKFLLSIAKAGNCTAEELKEVMSMVDEHSNHPVLGRVFGYSISDYAIATLKWIDSEDSLNEFNLIFSQLSKQRKQDIEEIILRKLHLEI